MKLPNGTSELVSSRGQGANTYPQERLISSQVHTQSAVPAYCVSLSCKPYISFKITNICNTVATERVDEARVRALISACTHISSLEDLIDSTGG
jgi:hypothetical protein